MGILDLYADSIRSAAQADLASAKPADPSFSLWALGRAGAGGVAAGALESIGGVRDLIRQMTIAQDERAMARAERRGQPYQPREIPTGGEALRKSADEFMPDPLTAHWSEQALSGIGRFGAKAAVEVGTLGPMLGAMTLGLDEANNTAQRLQAKGVDSATAWKTGAVQGGISAAGAVMPLAGSTLAKTAGLVALGGPVSYMAQEGLAREILQRAGYDKLAAEHDPTDPAGLALSTLLPALFGAVGLRHAKQMQSVKPLESVKTQKELREALQLSPEEQARSDAMERSAANLRELQAAVDKEKNPANKAILQAELDKQTKAAANDVRTEVATAAARRPEVVDAARVKLLDDTVSGSLPKDAPGALADVMRASDAVAAGERPAVPPMLSQAERDANFRAWFGESKVVDAEGRPMVMYHGTAGDFHSFGDPQSVENMRGMLAPWIERQDGTWTRGESPMDGRFFFTDDHRLANDYALGQMADGSGANVMPTYLSLKNPLVVDANGASGKDKFSLVERAIGDAIDGKHDGVIIRNVVDALAHDPGMHTEPTTVAVAFKQNQIKSATGNSGRFDPNSASLTDPLPHAEPAAPEARSALPDAEQVTTAPDVPAARTESAQAGAASPEQQVAQQLLKQDPAMPVRLPGDEKSISLADALERIKTEQKEEAGLAELVRVAAQCALTGGLTAARAAAAGARP